MLMDQTQMNFAYQEYNIVDSFPRLIGVFVAWSLTS